MSKAGGRTKALQEGVRVFQPAAHPGMLLDVSLHLPTTAVELENER